VDGFFERWKEVTEIAEFGDGDRHSGERDSGRVWGGSG
jgi:hypothetical protein